MQKIILPILVSMLSFDVMADRYGIHEPDFSGPGNSDFPFVGFIVAILTVVVVGYFWNKKKGDDSESMILNFATGVNVVIICSLIVACIWWGIENPWIIIVVACLWLWAKLSKT